MCILYKMSKPLKTDDKKVDTCEGSSKTEENQTIKITDETLLIKESPTNNINTYNVKIKRKKPTCKNCGKNKRKKMRIMLFDCRCDMKFCSECLLPENHNCDFDYRKMGKEILEKHNPKVDYKKIIHI